ncbi:MAG: MarC family protein, partial [Gemmatimonadales bacterium]
MGQFAFVTFTSILFLVDPIAVVPAYLAFVRTESPERRKATARAACIAAAITLLGFASAGDFILKIFGVTLPAFRIAGGFILWLVAMDMLRAKRSTLTQSAVSSQPKQEGRLFGGLLVFTLLKPSVFAVEPPLPSWASSLEESERYRS